MSLRARILVLVLAASVLPVLATLWLLLENRATTVAQAREQLAARADAIARDLDDKIAGTAQLLFGLGRVPMLDSEDRASCSDFLADVLKEHPQYTGLLTIRPDGIIHCDSLRTGRALDVSDRRYFQLARTAAGPVIEPVIGRLTGKGVLQIAYPVRGERRALRYVLLASLDMDAYGRAVASALPYARMHFQLWNHDGSIVMDFPGPGATRVEPAAEQRRFVLTPSAESTSTLGDDGTSHIWAKAALDRRSDARVSVALSVPEADLNERIDGQFKRALAGLVLLAVLAFVGAALFAELAVRRQAGRLIAGISRLDAGDFDAPIGTPYPRGELGQVMQALDRMAGSLREQREAIKRNTEALERQARVDALTSLANRHLLTERLDEALDAARRDERVAGVLMLDLDRFKTVNDSLGHSQGDLLLREVAARLTACVRAGDTVARLGGDEFVVVLANMAAVDDIVPVAQKILRVLAEPVEIGWQVLSVTTSLGIAAYPRDGTTAEGLLRYADTAMYRAKDQGGNAMAFFTPEMTEAMTERLEVEAGLRRALAHNDLRLHFQPIIDAASGRVVAAEALVRWADPKRGLVSPMQFVPIAEETGLIVPIGEWVLRQACLQARAWQKLGLGDIPVAVNLSVRQFSAPSLEESVREALRAAQCPPALLHLEITESSIMEQVDTALHTMFRLNALGVELTIDDFGTGYSSLTQLKRLPVGTVKIDRSFVGDLHVDPHDDVIVDTILSLAKKLGLRTIAEGVETHEQVAFLAARGCDAYQGFLFAHPCEADAFAHVLRERTGPRARHPQVAATPADREG